MRFTSACPWLLSKVVCAFWWRLTWPHVARRSWHHACFQLGTSLGMWRSMCTASGEQAEQGEWSSERCDWNDRYNKKCEYATSSCSYVNETMSWLRRSGESITLVTREDWRVASELITILERSGQVITPCRHPLLSLCLFSSAMQRMQILNLWLTS